MGVAFAAIAIGALVPAAVMSIAAANLFTRNIWREYVRPDATPAQESRVAKIVSLVVKVGALVFVIVLPTKYAIDLQLLGGVWILQTLPVGRHRPLHALARPPRAARRLGGRHGLGHRHGHRPGLQVLRLPRTLRLHINAYEAMFAPGRRTSS